MPYSHYAVTHHVPELLRETTDLVVACTAKGIAESHLAPLRELVLEGGHLALNPQVPAEVWVQFTARFHLALCVFEVAAIHARMEAPDVAAIA